MRCALLVGAWGGLALGLGVAAPAWAQVACKPLVRQGDAAPDAGPGAVLADVFLPQFQATGQITFYGVLSGPNIDASNDLAVFVLDPGGPRLALREHDPAPGIDGAFLGSFPRHAIARPGEELFHSMLQGPAIEASVNDQAAWWRTKQQTMRIYRSGDPAPDTEQGTVYRGMDGLAADRQGNVLFDAQLAGPAVTPQTAQAIYAGPAGGARLLARAGSPAPGAGGKLFNQMVLPRLGAGGQVAFIANVTGDAEHHYNRLFYGDAGGIGQAIAPAAHAPGTEDGVEFKSLWCKSVNALGQVLLPMDGALAGPGVDEGNDDGVWAGTPGSLQLVARSGAIAPGTGGKRFNGVYDAWLDDEQPMFIDPVLGDGGHVAFSARLADAEGGLLPEWGFWAGLPGNLKRIEDHAVRHPRINARGQMVYADNFEADGDPGTFETAMIFADIEGHRHVLVHTGQAIDFGGGNVRVVRGWDFDTNDIAPLSDSGQLLVTAYFTDGSTALLQATVPEPGMAPLLGFLAILGRRRGR